MITTIHGEGSLLEKRRAASRAYYAANREHLVTMGKARRDANPERHRAAGRSYYAANREKVAARSKAWRIANPERDRASKRAHYLANREKFCARRLERHLRVRYGLTVSKRNTILSDQENRCAICLITDPGCRGWQIDHSHKTGVVRGILCHACNVGLGRFFDNPDILRRAICYLELSGNTSK